MNKSPQILPLDILSIKRMGIEKWHSNYFWPVSMDFFIELSENVMKAFLDVQEFLSEEIQGAFLVNYKDFNSGLCMYIHAMEVIERSLDTKIIYTTMNKYNDMNLKHKITQSLYWDHLKGNKPLSKLFSHEIVNYSYYKKLLFKGNVIIKNFSLNGISTLQFSSNSADQILIGERLTPEMKSYANNRKIHRVPIESFNYPDGKVSKEISDSISVFFEYLHDHSIIKINKGNFDEIKSIMSLRLQKAYIYIIKLEKYLSKYKSVEVFANQLGNPLNRAFCQAANRLKIPTYGFTHGHYIGTQWSLWAQIMFFGVVNHFVCPTKGSKILFKKCAEKFEKLSRKKIRLTHTNNYSFFKTIYSATKNKEYKSKQKKIMFVEVGLTDSVQYWPYYLDLTIKAAKTLRKIPNLELILKKRPERLKESRGVYDDYFDKFIIEPFEDVYNLADVFIFFEFGTTTFPISILTNKPVIGFSHSINEHWNEYQELLYTRCNIVETTVNEKNAIIYNEDELINIINNLNNNSHKYVRKFYLN